jgi:hypothetical protein
VISKRPFIDQAEVETILASMEQDDSYNTNRGFVRDTPQSEKRSVSFKELHMNYLKKHPKINPEHYLSNLRTMLKIRP